MSRTIREFSFTTAQDLLEELKHLEMDRKVHLDEMYVEFRREHYMGSARVVEETLTDNSKVYNLEFYPE